MINKVIEDAIMQHNESKSEEQKFSFKFEIEKKLYKL